MTWLIGIIKIIVLLGTLVTIHELGHFLVAKACKVKVHKFAIGFGPKIFTKQKGETEYTLRVIPFGGFVQLEGEDERSEDERAFNKKPVWQRILIIIAGATVNIIFALVLYYLVCVSTNVYISSILKDVDNTSVAYQQGFRSGDEIVSINGRRTKTQNHVVNEISRNTSDEMTFVIRRNNELETLNVTIPNTEVGVAGMGFDKDANIVYVQVGGSAETAGIEVGDKLISIDGKEGLGITDYVNMIKEAPNKELDIKVTRENEELSYKITPSSKVVRIFDVSYTVLSRLNFFDNSYYAFDETGYYFNETIRAFVMLIAGKTKDAEVMGPVGIAGQITKTQGWVDFFYLMSAISLSLGIFNLLPVPALDGGKLLFLIIEGVRGKPLEQKTEISWQLAGFVIIIGLAIFVTIKDVINLF